VSVKVMRREEPSTAGEKPRRVFNLWKPKTPHAKKEREEQGNHANRKRKDAAPIKKKRQKKQIQ